MIKHISFDFWGTLCKSNPDYKPLRNELLRELFGDFIQDDVIAHNKQKFDVIVETTGMQCNYQLTMAFILGEYFMKIKKEKYLSKVHEFRLKNSVLVEQNPPILCDGVQEILDVLRMNHFTMSILSNTSFIEGRTLRSVINRMLPDYFYSMIFSDQEGGLAKPNQQIYWRMISMTTNSARNILHVGDNPIADSGCRMASGNTPLVKSLIVETNNIYNSKDKLYEICNLHVTRV